MRYGSARIAVMVVMLSWLLWVPRAFAEPYVGGYLGLALAADSDFSNADVSIPLPIPPDPTDPDSEGDIVQIAGRDLDFTADVDNSFTLGLRAGYWFDFFPLLGAQLDFYFFSPNLDIPKQPSGNIVLNDKLEFDISVVSFGLSVLGRYPFLKTPEFPRGRLQPYLGIGPAIFITSWDHQPFGADSAMQMRNDLGSETVVNGGLQFLVGVSYFIIEKVAAFAEYKYTHHVTQIGGTTRGGITVPTDGGNIEVFPQTLVGNQPFNISHLTFGVTYHFY